MCHTFENCTMFSKCLQLYFLKMLYFNSVARNIRQISYVHFSTVDSLLRWGALQNSCAALPAKFLALALQPISWASSGEFLGSLLSAHRAKLLRIAIADVTNHDDYLAFPCWQPEAHWVQGYQNCNRIAQSTWETLILGRLHPTVIPRAVLTTDASKVAVAEIQTQLAADTLWRKPGISPLSTGRRGGPTRGLLDWLWPVDGQPEQPPPASRGLPLWRLWQAQRVLCGHQANEQEGR